MHITPKQFNALTQQQRAGIFSRLFKWLGLGGIISGYGRYEESGRRTEGPSMTFQHDKGGMFRQIDTIRSKIINKKEGYF